MMVTKRESNDYNNNNEATTGATGNNTSATTSTLDNHIFLLPSIGQSELGSLTDSYSFDNVTFEDEEESNNWIDANINIQKRSTATSRTLMMDDDEEEEDNQYQQQQREEQQYPLFQDSVHKYKEEIMRKRRMTTKKSQLCKFTVDRVQDIHVLLPTKISSYIPLSTNDPHYDNHNSNISNNHKPYRRIPLIKGLERVFNGKQPASEAVYTCGLKPHRFLWFILSGLFCDIIQFLIDLVLYYILHIQSSTLCWVISLTLSIAIRHTSHRYLVFGNYVGGYYHSLIRMYTGYSIILISSTIFNLTLTGVGKMKHYSAYVVTLIMTNVMNYILLRKLWNWDSGKRWNKCFAKRKDDNNNNGGGGGGVSSSSSNTDFSIHSEV